MKIDKNAPNFRVALVGLAPCRGYFVWPGFHHDAGEGGKGRGWTLFVRAGI